MRVQCQVVLEADEHGFPAGVDAVDMHADQPARERLQVREAEVHGFDANTGEDAGQCVSGPPDLRAFGHCSA